MIIPTINKLILLKDFDAACDFLYKNKKRLPYMLFEQKLAEIHIAVNSQEKINKYINKCFVEFITNLSL